MLRDILHNDWLTAFIFLGLVFIAFAKYLYANRFMDFIGVLGNSKYLKIYARDQKFIDGFDTLLFLNLVISISVFGYVSYQNLIYQHPFDILIFLKVIFAVAAIILIKTLLERLIGSLFDIDKLMDIYLFQKTSYKNYTGFVLFTINLLLVYTMAPTELICYIVIGIVVAINLIGFIITLKNHQNIVVNNLFYFILYLCALEIGPYLILYKLIIEFKA
jgi:hypothetical protein